MITKTYICDVCNKSVGEGELTKVNISLEMIPIPNQYKRTVSASRDICKDCLAKKNIFVEVLEGQKADDVVAKNKKTIEDKLIDILEYLGVVFE